MRVTFTCTSKVDKPVALICGANWHLECRYFLRDENWRTWRKKPEQGEESTTNSTHMWCHVQELNPGHSGGRQVLSPLCNSCIPMTWKVNWFSIIQCHSSVCQTESYMQILFVSLTLLPVYLSIVFRFKSLRSSRSFHRVWWTWMES